MLIQTNIEQYAEKSVQDRGNGQHILRLDGSGIQVYACLSFVVVRAAVMRQEGWLSMRVGKAKNDNKKGLETPDSGVEERQVK